MPFPGSQVTDSIGFAYFIHLHIWWLRILGIIIIIFPLVYFSIKGKLWQRIIILTFAVMYTVVCFLFNYRFLADKIFYKPDYVEFKTINTDTTNKQTLIIGVTENGIAKAYPINIIGYHHQVEDTLNNKPILITYCTVCRTGRVYSPLINTVHEHFRLVGMDHFNAMLEDSSTKSWWRQANGIAIAGRRKGEKLTEIPSSQMTLADWIELHPNTFILQGDTTFAKKYDKLKPFDEGTIKSSLEKRDSSSWKNKSWVVGLTVKGMSKAYDWNDLVKERIISDTLQNIPVLISIEPNNKTFYAFTTLSDSTALHMQYNTTGYLMEDAETHSQWKMNGVCIAGKLQGKRLEPIQAYQEFWHSWSYFHPNTKKYIK
ncbi:MAG: DUF3179 domain-containing protein [Sphingobacteriia bacterium]|nr:DUF3179 domain-containing protein [Sphingobacteriia bacterium]